MGLLQETLKIIKEYFQVFSLRRTVIATQEG